MMGIEFITLAIVLSLFLLMAMGVPLGASTLLISVTTAYLAFGPNGFILVSSAVGKVMDKHVLIAVPFFVFMANIMERSGIAKELFNSMAILGGQMRGGVAVQTCVVSVILAAMSGIVGGEVVLLGLIALPQLFRLGYDRKLAIGIITSSGALATLIPRSIVMIINGAEANVSIKDLFTAGIMPGILLASLYITYVLIRVRLNPAMGPVYDAPEAHQIYMLSPPFGPACFYLKSVAPKDATLHEIFISILPFIGLQIIGLALVMAFPQIALWLPGLSN